MPTLFLRLRSNAIFAVLVALSCSAIVFAAVAGLPFTEDFTDSSLQDSAATTANWDTAAGNVQLPEFERKFGSLQVSTTTLDTNNNVLGQASDSEAADMDGDGDLDLVIAQTDTQNMLLLNNGTSTPFAGVMPLLIGTETDTSVGVAIADLDNDGDKDVVFANSVGIVNRYYLNNGTANPFNGVTGLDIGTADESLSVSVADIDQDGDQDVVFGRRFTNVLFLNNGTSVPFDGVVAQDITADSYATTSTALADMNDDGFIDLVTGNLGAHARLYLHNGTADPFNGVASTLVSPGFESATKIAIGDLDNDGRPDVVVATSVGQNKVFINVSTDSVPFSSVSATSIMGPVNSQDIDLRDIDGDGDLDIIAANRSSSPYVTLNSGMNIDPFLVHTSNPISPEVDESTLSTTVADFDADGDLDVVATVFGAKFIYYANNSGISPFNGVTPTAISADAFASHSITSGDINNDGNLDVVIGTDAGDTLKRYLGNGDGTFGTSADIGTNTFENESVTLADINNDGNIDLVVANYSDVNTYYLGNGDGTFAAAVAITADADTTYNTSVGDVNNDGLLDVVASNRYHVNRVYLNDGVGTLFDVSADVSADVDESDGALADVNNDGNLDFVVGVAINMSNRLHLGNGDGTFTASTPTDNTSRNTSKVLIRDINNDGNVDIISVNHLNLNEVAINDGTGDPFDTFGVVTIPGFSSIGPDVVAEDFDKDGDVDLIITNRTTNGSSRLNPLYIMNDGDSDPFSTQYTEISTESVNKVTTGDFDNDGDIDFIGTRNGNTDMIYLNNSYAIGVNGVDRTTVSTSNCSDIQLGDVDNDGDLDLLITRDDFVTTDRLLLNDGDGNPFDTIAEQDVISSVSRSGIAAFADFNNDGNLDYVAVNSASGLGAQLMLHGGTGALYNGQSYTSITGDVASMNDVQAVDINNDGHIDVVVAVQSAPNRLYLNDGVGDPFDTTVGTDITADVGISSAIAYGDLDHDGDLDLVTAEFGGLSRVYLNDGVGDPFDTVTSTTVSADTNSTWDIILADMNNDSHLDVIEINRAFSRTNYLYLGNGDGTFAARTTISTGGDSYEGAVVDFDQDGNLDLLTVNSSGVYYLYLNDGVGDPFDTIFEPVAFGESTGFWQHMAVGDIDNDGDTDMVTCAWGIVRLVRNRTNVYDTEKTLVQSLRVDTETANVTAASLTPTAASVNSTNIDYYLSNDGGSTWKVANPGATVNFSAGGTDVRWKAVLRSLSPIITPVLSQIFIENKTLPPAPVVTTITTTNATQVQTTGGGGGPRKMQRVHIALENLAKRQYAQEQPLIHAAAKQEKEEHIDRPAFVTVMIDEQEVVFTDVSSSAWFAEYVQRIIEAGIANGYTDQFGKPKGEYGPTNAVTYAEIIKMLIESMDKDLSEFRKSPANTSAKNQWSAKYIAYAEQKDVSILAPSVDVNTPSTRGEVVQVIVELLNLPSDNTKTVFTDVPNHHPNAAAIATATKLGFVSGDGDSAQVLFRPNDPVNRAEIAKVLTKVLEYLENM